MKRFGFDFLGAAMYAGVIKQTFPSWAAFGAFDKEFGDCTLAANEAYSKGCRFFRIQLLWHGNHIYGDSDMPAMIQGAKKWEAWKRKHSDAIVCLSFACEHRLGNPDKYLKLVNINAPSCMPVNSPLANGALSNIYWNEFHAAEKKPRASKTPYLFSFDGTACVDANVEAYKKSYANAEAFFWWDARFNLHAESNKPDRNTPPDASLIASITALNYSKGICKLQTADLWKSHSEYSTDWRSEKPCFISYEESTHAELRLNKNTIMTLARYPGNLPDGRARYYASKMGYEIASVPCEVWINGKLRGTVNPGFRENEWRV